MNSLFCIVLYLGLLLIAFSADAQPAHEANYWVSYEDLGVGRGLLQIDSTGDLVISPRIVIPISEYGPTGGSDASAITNGGANKILMWIIGRANAIETRFRLFKAVIDKESVRKVSIVRTSFVSSKNYIQASQKKGNNFLAALRRHEGTPFLMGLDIDSDGNLQESPYPLSSQDLGIDLCRSSSCGGGVSADGKMAYLIERDSIDQSRLFIQRLGRERNPIGDPQLIEELTNEQGLLGGIWSADVTNELPGEIRFLVYVWSPQPSFTFVPNKLYLQKVHSKTGKKIGDRILLYKYELIQASQSVAIAPDGKFVLFAIDNRQGSRFGGANVVVFLPLDSLGQKSGRARVLVNSYSGEIDILKD
jgi:hypothetical protein